MVRRETAADMLQLMHGRPARAPERPHARMMDVLAALLQIAWRARRDDVLPCRAATLRTRHNVIEGEIVRRAAILASEAIAQEHIEARERRRAILMDIIA